VSGGLSIAIEGDNIEHTLPSSIPLEEQNLTPKALNFIFWQHSNFGQLTMIGGSIFFL